MSTNPKTHTKYNAHSSFILALLMAICALILVIVGIVIRVNHSNDPTTSEYQIRISQDTDNIIRGIHYEYMLNGKAIVSGDIVNADGSDIKTGDALYINLNSDMLPAGTNPKDVSVRLYVINQHGNRELISPVLSFTPEYGKTYTYQLQGNAPYYRLSLK